MSFPRHRTSGHRAGLRCRHTRWGVAYRPGSRAGSSQSRDNRPGGAALRRARKGSLRAAAFGFPPWLAGGPPAFPAWTLVPLKP